MMDYRAYLGDFLGRKALHDAIEHAKVEFPKESCGFVANNEYVPCVNNAADPEQDFTLNDPLYEQAIIAGTIQAIIHSHPKGPIFPSSADMHQQIASDLTWVIIATNDEGDVSEVTAWGGKLPHVPLIGRPFVHGILDCYSCIREAYALGKEGMAAQGMGWPLDPIALDEFPRDDEWWVRGDDLYMKNLHKQGFVEISRSDAQPGDLMLFAIGDRRINPHKQINHAGVLLEHGLILHHLPKRLSRREPVGAWARAVNIWARYEGSK